MLKILLRTIRCGKLVATALFALMILRGAEVQAADWTYTDTTSLPGDIIPAGVVPDSAGFWMLGTSGTVDVLARYGNNAAPVSLRYFDPLVTRAFHRLVDSASLGQAGFVALVQYGNEFGVAGCSLQRFAANGGSIWHIDLAGNCVLFGMDASAGGWVYSDDGIFRVAPDGAATKVATTSAGAGAVDAQSGRLYLAAPPVAGSSANPAQAAKISAYDTSGAAHLVYTVSDTSATLTHLALGSDGNLFAVGTLGTGPRYVHALSITPAGTLRWEKSLNGGIDTQDNTSVVATKFLADGTAIVLDEREIVFRFDKDGNGFVGPGLGSGLLCDPAQGCSDRIDATATGDFLALITTRAPTALVRFRDGTVIANTSYPGIAPESATLTVLADGSALVGSNGQTPPVFFRSGNIGEALTAPALQQVVSTGARLSDVTQGADGSVYVLSEADVTDFDTGSSGTTTHLWLSKLSPDGQLVWKQPLGFSNVLHYGISADRVCSAGFQVGSVIAPRWMVECRALDTGALLWTTPVADQNSTVQTRLLADNDVVAVALESGGSARQVVFAPDGSIRRDTDLGAFDSSSDPLAIGANGTVVISALTATGKVFAWDRNGVALYATAIPTSGTQFVESAPVLADDGSALLAPVAFQGQINTTYLWSLSPTGQTRWFQTQLASEVIVTASRLDASVADVFSRSAINMVHLRKLSAATGALQSEAFIEDEQFADFPHFDAVTGILVNRTGARVAQRARVRLLDPDNLGVLRGFAEDCANSICDSFSRGSATLSSDHTIHIARGTIDESTGVHFRVVAISHADTLPAVVPIAQPGLDGAWYGAYEGGQGFTFDFVASANVVFMPWFTYALFPANDPSALKWYTLQGSVNSSDHVATLGIAVTDPGVFNAGAVGVHQAGTALLSFTDCNSGLLIYQFDANANPGLGGAISLSRLSPSTSPCVLANGSAAPAQIANAANGGFDARQSGSWFDPQTGGQGVELTIIPAGGNFAGLVFAAWFTYDPAGHADDQTQQHWFTLQGNLAAAADGRITLPILSTIGGGFDGVPTGNTVQVGTATLTMQACDKAQLAYQFDSIEVAHAYKGLSGSLALVKIGGCAP